MSYTFDLSKANEEAAIIVAVGGFAADYLVTFDGFQWFGFVRAIGAAILAGIGVLGYTGVVKSA